MLIPLATVSDFHRTPLSARSSLVAVRERTATTSARNDVVSGVSSLRCTRKKKTSNVPVFKLQSAETIINVLLRVNYWYIKIGREWNARTEAWIPWLMICWFLGLEKARTWSEIRPFLEVVNGAIQLFVTLPRQIQPYWCSLDRTQQVESEMNSDAKTTKTHLPVHWVK